MLDLFIAFNEARLGAIHIDPQLRFHEHTCREGRVPTKDVFPVMKDFANDLRSHGVPNNWVAYTGYWNKLPYQDFKRGNYGEGRSFLARDLSMLTSVGISDDEWVFEKAEQWAFNDEHCVLGDHFRAQGVDTLIIDGVKDKHCIAGTIATGLKQGFRFYVAMDATNCPPDQTQEYAKWFLKPDDLTPKQKENVTFTDTQTIKSTLQAASLPQRIYAHG